MNPFDDAPIIHRYTRADALEDGVLVEVTATAREAGIRFPVALTRAVWTRYVEVPAGVEGQDERGRLWDVLWMLRGAIRASVSSNELVFTVRVRNDHRSPRPFQLRAVCGPGDDGEPVITVLLPGED